MEMHFPPRASVRPMSSISSTYKVKSVAQKVQAQQESLIQDREKLVNELTLLRTRQNQVRQSLTILTPQFGSVTSVDESLGKALAMAIKEFHDMEVAREGLVEDNQALANFLDHVLKVKGENGEEFLRTREDAVLKGEKMNEDLSSRVSTLESKETTFKEVVTRLRERVYEQARMKDDEMQKISFLRKEQRQNEEKLHKLRSSLELSNLESTELMGSVQDLLLKRSSIHEEIGVCNHKIEEKALSMQTLKSEQQSEMDIWKKRLAAAEQENQKLQVSLKSLNEKTETSMRERDVLREKVGEFTTDLNAKKAELEAMKQKCEELVVEISTLQDNQRNSKDSDEQAKSLRNKLLLSSGRILKKRSGLTSIVLDITAMQKSLVEATSSMNLYQIFGNSCANSTNEVLKSSFLLLKSVDTEIEAFEATTMASISKLFESLQNMKKSIPCFDKLSKELSSLVKYEANISPADIRGETFALIVETLRQVITTSLSPVKESAARLQTFKRNLLSLIPEYRTSMGNMTPDDEGKYIGLLKKKLSKESAQLENIVSTFDSLCETFMRLIREVHNLRITFIPFQFPEYVVEEQSTIQRDNEMAMTTSAQQYLNDKAIFQQAKGAFDSVHTEFAKKTTQYNDASAKAAMEYAEKIQSVETAMREKETRIRTLHTSRMTILIEEAERLEHLLKSVTERSSGANGKSPIRTFSRDSTLPNLKSNSSEITQHEMPQTVGAHATNSVNTGGVAIESLPVPKVSGDRNTLRSAPPLPVTSPLNAPESPVSEKISRKRMSMYSPGSSGPYANSAPALGDDGGEGCDVTRNGDINDEMDSKLRESPGGISAPPIGRQRAKSGRSSATSNKRQGRDILARGAVMDERPLSMAGTSNHSALGGSPSLSTVQDPNGRKAKQPSVRGITSAATLNAVYLCSDSDGISDSSDSDFEAGNSRRVPGAENNPAILLAGAISDSRNITTASDIRNEKFSTINRSSQAAASSITTKLPKELNATSSISSLLRRSNNAISSVQSSKNPRISSMITQQVDNSEDEDFDFTAFRGSLHIPNTGRGDSWKDSNKGRNLPLESAKIKPNMTKAPISSKMTAIPYSTAQRMSSEAKGRPEKANKVDRALTPIPINNIVQAKNTAKSVPSTGPRGPMQVKMDGAKLITAQKKPLQSLLSQGARKAQFRDAKPIGLLSLINSTSQNMDHQSRSTLLAQRHALFHRNRSDIDDDVASIAGSVGMSIFGDDLMG